MRRMETFTEEVIRCDLCEEECGAESLFVFKVACSAWTDGIDMQEVCNLCVNAVSAAIKARRSIAADSMHGNGTTEGGK